MAVWFTADLHLGHANIIKYCNRPFMNPEEQRQARLNPRSKHLHISDETVERHDDALIASINALVGEEDELWILGDFCWGEYGQANLYRKRIRCQRVHLVWGNHDDRSIKKCFSQVLECGMIEVEDQPIWLQHSPQDHWQGQDTGSWHLFGDVHGALDAADAIRRGWRRKDVGVDASRFIPWSFRDLRCYMGAHA
jgi:calcineurin-like phosphoesterase family protein